MHNVKAVNSRINFNIIMILDRKERQESSLSNPVEKSIVAIR